MQLQWDIRLEPEAHLEKDVANRDVEGYIVAM
jgi:hypothetical protein